MAEYLSPDGWVTTYCLECGSEKHNRVRCKMYKQKCKKCKELVSMIGRKCTHKRRIKC